MQNRKKIVKRILKESIETLKMLLKNVDGNKMPITSMEVYMVDPDGDGIGLQFKYDEETNEIEKVATPIEDNELTFWDGDMDEEEDEVWSEEITDQFHTAAVSKRLLN
jgi:hypothetical protein